MRTPVELVFSAGRNFRTEVFGLKFRWGENSLVQISVSGFGGGPPAGGKVLLCIIRSIRKNNTVPMLDVVWRARGAPPRARACVSTWPPSRETMMDTCVWI